jgi:translocation and assembly module TamA
VLLAACITAFAGEVTVQVRGVDGDLRDNVFAHLGMLPFGRRDQLSARERQEIVAKGVAAAHAALRPFGYYAPQVDASVSTGPDGNHTLDLTIHAGEPVVVEAVDIALSGDGAEHRSAQRWRDSWPLVAGARLDQTAWETNKQIGIRQAESVGFLAAEFAASEISLDLEKNRARLRLELDTGPRYVMGNIDFGEHVLGPGVLESVPRFDSGDFYSTRLVDKLRIDLQATGYFTDVEVVEVPDQDSVPPSVDFRVALETEFRNRYQGAIGFGTDTGVRLQGNFSRHPMSTRGDRIDVGIGWRESDEELALRGTYRIPRAGHRRQFWVADGTLKSENRDLEVKRSDEDENFIKLANGNIDERHLRLGRLKVSNREAGESQVLTMLFVQFLNSRNNYALDSRDLEFSLNPEDIDLVAQGTNNAASIGIESTAVGIEGKGWKTEGKRDGFWLFASVFSETPDSDFIQAYLSARRIYPLGERFKVLLRGQVGYTDARVDEVSLDVGDFPLELSVTRLPTFYRFRAGGSSSVRGYGFEQLSNNNVGSNNIITASAEIEMRVLSNWSAAVFVDTGNAFNDWSHPELKTGIGVGIRWYSIAGPIQIDVAQALDFQGKPWRLHFTMGTPLL